MVQRARAVSDTRLEKKDSTGPSGPVRWSFLLAVKMLKYSLFPGM
jgi:hypothetical protein